jgi:hypothetical protein
VKIKKTQLKKMITECVLEELFHRGKTPKIKDMPEDEAIIDLWANLLDVASRDAKWTREIFDEVPEKTLMLLGFQKGDRDRPLSESAEAFKKQIMKAVGRDSGKKRELKNDLIKLARGGEISRKWMLSSSGHGDLVKKIANIPDPVAPAAEPTTPDTAPTTAEPDVTPTTAEPDVAPTTAEPATKPSSVVPMPPGMTPRGLKAKDVLSKSLTQTEMPDMETVNQLRQFDKTSGRKFEKALRASQLFGAKVKGRSGVNLDDNDYLNIVRSIYTALNKLGVTKLSESKLKKIILEEVKVVVKKSNKS